jgi:hypothetical protein
MSVVGEHAALQTALRFRLLALVVRYHNKVREYVRPRFHSVSAMQQA